MDEARTRPAAVFDGFLVLGSEEGVKAVIDTGKGGETLSDDEHYTDAIDDASDDRLGLFYLNSPQLLKALRQRRAPLPENVQEVLRGAGRRDASTPTTTA